MRLAVPLLSFSLLLLVACNSAPAAQPTAAPIAAPTVGAPTALPTATPEPGPTRNPLLPTLPPRATAMPTSQPAAEPAAWWNDAVCYEIFVRSFFDSDNDGVGDINGMTARLDYLNDGDPATDSDLGVTCVWLMPVAESTSYHGYDVEDYYTIERDYGTNEDFKRFVQEAQARGIKVVVDLVLNHTSVEHPWFKDAAANPASPYRDWFLWSATDPRYLTPWSTPAWHATPGAADYYYGIFWSGMPDLNYRNPAVTAEARKITRYWVEEFGVDGFRLDAIKHLIEYDQIQADTIETKNWLREYRAWIDQELPGTYTIGEIFGAGPFELKGYFPDMLTSYFEFDVAEAIVNAANSGLPSDLLRALKETERYPDQRWSPFLTNHDQNRVMSTLRDDVAKARMAAAALLTLPGLPYIYYGEEIGMLGVKPDEQIRTPMQWNGELYGGFSTRMPWQVTVSDYATKNVELQAADPDSLYNTYRQLIQLHVASPALSRGDLHLMQSLRGRPIGYLRHTDEQIMLVLLNFGDKPAEGYALKLAASDLPPGTYNAQLRFGTSQLDVAPITINADGSVDEWLPLAEFPPRTALIVELTP
jgi:alpha-amylase